MKSRLLVPLIGGFVMWFAESVFVAGQSIGRRTFSGLPFSRLCTISVGESLSVVCGPSVVLLESLRVVV